MGRELTRRHSGMFERRIPNPLQFINDLKAYEKVSELGSFVAWELMHKLRLFPQDSYLKFTEHDALSLQAQRPGAAEFNAQLAQAFAAHGWGVTAAAQNWKLLLIDGENLLGCQLPLDRNLYQTPDGGRWIRLLYTFPQPIKSIYLSRQDTLFVCVKGSVYTSWDDGKSFQKTLKLGSSESFFRHNNAMTETPDGTLVIGEYGNVWEKTHWKKLAYLYFSRDNGRNWTRSDFLIQQGINKHVHLVKYSHAFDRLFVADGDNKKKLWRSTSANAVDFTKDTGWTPVNRYHIQMGGYTSVVEDNGAMLFGTDYQGGTNFLVTTTDGETFRAQVVPDPYRRSPIDNMVQRLSRHGSELWANLPYSTSKSKCLLMCSVDGGKTWKKLIDYNRAAYKVWIVSSSTAPTHDLYVSIEELSSNARAVYRISDLV